MPDKTDVWQGTLALMVLKTIETMGPLHGYGIARRIEQTSGNLLSLNYGTLYPALLKLEQEGSIASEWGSRKTTARQNFTSLHALAASRLKEKHKIGSRLPPSWRASFLLPRTCRETATCFVLTAGRRISWRPTRA